jgi:TonB family protein
MRPYAALALLFLALPARALHDPATPGGIAPPELTRYVAPEYPREAREGGFEGEVVLELEIDATGALHDVRIVEDPGHGLGEAAAAAARRFQFSPAHGPDGEPIAAIIRFSHRFDLHGDESGDAPKSGPHPPPAEAPLPEGSYAETVKGERPFTAASSTEIRDRDFLLRPRTTPSDILRVVPGLVTAQHAGGGKADQLFLRGFDADHGTDVAIFVDGVPVNLPTHGHGQGYADLHWLIPEAVESVEVRKGPYHADLGDFDTAGAVLLKTKERFASSSVSVLGGQLGTFRVLGIAAPDLGASRPFFAAEVYGTDGPFEYPQGLRRYNVFAKETWALSPRDQVTALATGYAAQWRASGQIPERAVGVPGGIDRFGAIDPTEGGNTERQMLTVGYSHREASSDFSLSAYAVRTRLSLFSDFTFQARDPVHGDQIDQTDDRVYAGFNARYRKTFTLLDRPGAVTLGAGDRMDGVDNELVHVEKRQRLDGCFPDPVTGSSRRIPASRPGPGSRTCRRGRRANGSRSPSCASSPGSAAISSSGT